MLDTLAKPPGQQVEPLRVGVEGADPVRTSALAALVAAAGHEVVWSGLTDLVLADGAVETDRPLLVLSDAAEPAGSHLPRGIEPRQLDAALRAVAAGLVVRAPSSPPAVPSRPVLTPRELEILGCLGDGLSNKAVARRLDISQHTVKFHMEAIYAKLDVRSRAEAVVKGLRTGLIDL
jgi:DNA-binding CsgD family transcriptional regulator